MYYKCLNQSGKRVSQAKGKVKAKSAIRAKDFPGKKFDKLDDEYMSELLEAIWPTIEQSMQNSVNKI